MKNIIAALKRLFTTNWQEEREQNYLNGAVDILDLEQRMREIDRSRAKGNFPF